MDWIDHFTGNARRRIDIDWSEPIEVPAHVRGPLVRSLQRFQVGESGEGRHLRAGAKRTGDVVYAEAIRLFLAEEHVHASYIRRMLDGLGAPTIRAHWSDALFVAGRRLLGLRLELPTLLAAEAIAMYYYRMLRDRVDNPLVRRVCSQILRDEAGHIAFHTERLADDMARRSTVMRLVTRGVFAAVHTAAMFVVALDHRELIVALGVGPGEFMRECEAVYDRIDRRIFGRRRSSGVAAELESELAPVVARSRAGAVR